jgi:hypothetical protein
MPRSRHVVGNRGSFASAAPDGRQGDELLSRPRERAGSAYRRCMQDTEEIRSRMRRADRAVLAGVCLVAVALLISSWKLAPAMATSLAAIVGFGLVSYGVHVAWLVFYEREPDGPSS